ncbi:sigma-E processing peptidase SpoIIGA [Herbivorax sp. ANBcel31]|uniref:sigma-E processing peptidase SpoIIGA n=1 Tax=Herbivorax sp. ANBcel31 TaxID=3069754 RepID=UPI0027ADCB4F|nr:sigma-E processing peptidase SpoIIGA [Herbivorax sp. ANBcel31]MDQ2085910.1 sigma-E processing peptidase SpoIIGA [Herbivorax sp. ANBcel31]
MEIYIDVLILQNVVMNYLILMMTAKLSKTKISSLRLLIGSLVGASYVVFLLMFPDVEIYYTTAAKILLSFFIVAVTFYPPKPMIFMRILAIFYISTFIFAGAAFAFLYFNNTGGLVQNGIFYIFDNSKWSVLFFSVITVYIIIKIFWDLIQERFIKDNLCIPLKIAFENGKIDLFALVDTGNSLHDPLTNVPVVVVEFSAIRNILPIDIQNIFENSKEDDLVCATKVISDSKWFSRFRLIPFTSLGKENGMLIGFKPDYIEIGENIDKKGVSNVIIGIYNRTLSNNDNYNALLSPELV